MHFSSSILYFNEQWTTLIPAITQTSSSLRAMLTDQGPPKTDFGTCRWNCDVAQGKSLLSQRANEINDMALNTNSWDLNQIYNACRRYDVVSEVDIKLKNLIKRIDSIWNIWFIWNLICNLVTGSSRSIKNEEKKLDQLYSNHKAIIDRLKFRSDDLLNNAVANVDTQIDQYIQRFMPALRSEQNRSTLEEQIDRQFKTLEKSLGELNCYHFQDIFLAKVTLAKANALQELLGA